MKRIIAGTMNWGQWGANFSVSDMESMIKRCIDTGVNCFDHADIYGGYTTEEVWGKAWANLSVPRKDIKIISKCGICMPCDNRQQYQLKYYDNSTQHIITSAKRSIENLQCDYLDVLLIHRPSPIMDPRAMAEAFAHLESEGLVKSFGVSNFSPSQIELLRNHFPIAINQIEISLLHLDPFINGTLDYCRTHNIEVQAWSPLGGGQLFKKSKDYDFVVKRARLKNIADKYNWALDEMGYLFLLHHPADIRLVLGTTKIERLQRAITTAGRSISDAQWFEIWEASQGTEVP